jgi:hypothetical protein
MLRLLEDAEYSDVQLPLECQPCLVTSRGLAIASHLPCRIYQYLYVRRKRWTDIEALTMATYDITGDRRERVRKAISDLRYQQGINIGSRGCEVRGRASLEYMLGAENSGR